MKAFYFLLCSCLLSLSSFSFANSEFDERDAKDGIVVQFSADGKEKTIYHVTNLKDVLKADGTLNTDAIKSAPGVNVITSVIAGTTPKSELDEGSSTSAYWHNPNWNIRGSGYDYAGPGHGPGYGPGYGNGYGNGQGNEFGSEYVYGRERERRSNYGYNNYGYNLGHNYWNQSYIYFIQFPQQQYYWRNSCWNNSNWWHWYF